MNPSKSLPNIKRLRDNSRQRPMGFLMHAFKLPSTNPGSSLPRSQWIGNPVCEPRVVVTPQTFRVATVRRKLLTASQRTGHTDPEVSDADRTRPFPGTDENVSETLIPHTSPTPTSIWLFVIENLVQVTVLALAIAGSIQTRRRVLVHLVAVLSVPQLALMVNRITRRIRSPVQPVLAPTDSQILVDGGPDVPVEEPRAPVSVDEHETSVSEPAPSQEREQGQKKELSLVQSKIISTSIRTAVADEVGALRYAIEQIEQTTEEREQARNLVIAEAIAALDGSLRSLRRSIDTRNQVEKSAPFALVSELEIVKSRLKQAEQEKGELEVRVRVAEDNFEEAKRQGERARREADEASTKELSLRTELALASSRLLRLEEVTDRLAEAERRNDELQEQLISGTREQEGLRQSAEDAARRVVRVENIAEILRDKIQELSGKPLTRYGQDGGDSFGDMKEKSEDQFWSQRLRGKGDLRPDSVVYQEFLRKEKRAQSPEWPRDPLGFERGAQDKSQVRKLPDDGGFGVEDTLTDQSVGDGASSEKLLSPEGSGDTIFSFSRGEFDDIGLEKEHETPSEEETQSSKESLKTQAVSSDVASSPRVSTPVSKKSEDSPTERSQSRSQVEKPSKMSSTEPVELTKEAVDGMSKSYVETGASVKSQYKPKDTDVTAPEGVGDDTSNRGKEVETIQKSTDSVEPDITSGSDGEKQYTIEGATHVRRTETPKDDETVSTELSYDSSQPHSDSGSSIHSHRQTSEPSSPWIASDEPKAPTVQKTASYLESLSENGQSREHETIEDQSLIEKEELQPAETVDDQQTRPAETVEGEQSRLFETIGEKAQPRPVEITEGELESLSEMEEPRPVETVEEKVRTARDLVKKARTRGLAVKQADLLFQKATKKFESALEQVDDRPELEADLGGCLLAWAKTDIAGPFSQERLSRALQMLTGSVESLPDNEAVLFNTGLCLCLVASTSVVQTALGHYQKACEMYERLLQLNDNSRVACFNCGLAYVSLGRLSLGNEGDEKSRSYFERAATLFQRSLEMKPGDSKAISYLDDCRRQLRELDVL